VENLLVRHQALLEMSNGQQLRRRSRERRVEEVPVRAHERVAAGGGPWRKREIDTLLPIA
jgi:hypothetical protein